MVTPLHLMLATGAFLGTAMLLHGRTRRALSRGFTPPRIGSDQGVTDLVNLINASRVDAAWEIFFLSKAWGESKWKPHVRNDRSAEIAAAQRAYVRNAEWYTNCPWPKHRYTHPGSGGYLGVIAPNGLAAFWGTNLQCMDPHMIMDGPANYVMALYYAKRLQRWSNFRRVPTWQNLWVGWRRPGSMGEPGALARIESHFAKGLAKIAEPHSFMKLPVTSLPKLPAANILYNNLRAVA